jgi:hypothetical protein
MMSLQLNIGDGSSAAQMITVAVNAGDSINIANLAASNSAINYLTNGIDGGATSLAPGANVTVTVPTWLQAQSGVATVKLSGGQYGA